MDEQSGLFYSGYVKYSAGIVLCALTLSVAQHGRQLACKNITSVIPIAFCKRCGDPELRSAQDGMTGILWNQWEINGYVYRHCRNSQE